MISDRPGVGEAAPDPLDRPEAVAREIADVTSQAGYQLEIVPACCRGLRRLQ